ncbi:MAG: aldehyde dehydrogenase family protein [Paracoccaceae bacterium]
MRKRQPMPSTGDTQDGATTMGPLVSKMQFDKVQALIQTGIDEGATLVAGGSAVRQA